MTARQWLISEVRKRLRRGATVREVEEAIEEVLKNDSCGARQYLENVKNANTKGYHGTRGYTILLNEISRGV